MNQLAGLTDKNTEVYAVQGKALCTHQGEVFPFHRFPKEIKKKLWEDFNRNEPAQKAIIEDWQIVDPEEALEKYITCRFGGIDFFPDLANGELTPDYHHCPVRSSCPHDGVICSKLQGPHGEISLRELEVLIHIALGRMEKEIADILNIEMVTVKKHRKALFDKTGAQSSVQLAQFAFKRNLIPTRHEV